MLACWNLDPCLRPDFNDLIEYFTTLAGTQNEESENNSTASTLAETNEFESRVNWASNNRTMDHLTNANTKVYVQIELNNLTNDESE